MMDGIGLTDFTDLIDLMNLINRIQCSHSSYEIGMYISFEFKGFATYKINHNFLLKDDIYKIRSSM